MTRFNPTQLASLTEHSTGLLDSMKQAIQDGLRDPTPLMHSIGNLLMAHGMPGAAFAVRSWFDHVIEATPHAQIGMPVVARFTNTDNTSILPRHQLTPERAWAGDAIAARFAADQVRLYKLLEDIPRDRRALIYLFRALEMSAGILLSYENPPEGIKPGLYEPVGNGRYHHLGSTT